MLIQLIWKSYINWRSNKKLSPFPFTKLRSSICRIHNHNGRTRRGATTSSLYKKNYTQELILLTCRGLHFKSRGFRTRFFARFERTEGKFRTERFNLSGSTCCFQQGGDLAVSIRNSRLIGGYCMYSLYFMIKKFLQLYTPIPMGSSALLGQSTRPGINGIRDPENCRILTLDVVQQQIIILLCTI